MLRVINLHVLLLLAAALLVSGMECAEPPAGIGYEFDRINADGGVQHRFFLDGFHFMTVIDQGGTFFVRPRPGLDPNGWGSTWFAMAFLPGAILRGAEVGPIEATESGILVSAEGLVSRNQSDSIGTWAITMEFVYFPDDKKITGAGTYSIQLDAPLSPATGDLNLYRISSNFLLDVPLLDGMIGNTGDMSLVHFEGDGFSRVWNPAEPGMNAHFPTDLKTDTLAVDVSGEFNQIDTVAQGEPHIAPAYKPSLKVVLSSQDPGVPMVFGAIFDLSMSRAFYSDNIGVTPLVLIESEAVEFHFDVDFESVALPGDGSL